MRSHNNAELRINHVGIEVSLVGWVAKKRNLGGLIFIDIRDRYGITQIVAHPQDEVYGALEEVRSEYVLKVTGVVVERENKNMQLATGEIEVLVKSLEVLNKAETTPLIIADETDALEDVRMKYRYLDLRRPVLQKNLILRHKVTKSIRNYFDEREFIEIETPIFGKSTPEGARDYLVPSRVHPGKFYALPQSPQIYKQLLMISGFERYYQIVKCFRDEDLRADRQMEFTQIDLEMSFVDEEDIYLLIEGMLSKLMKDVMGIDIPKNFPRLSFEESMDRYGTDKPDTRFSLELNDFSEVFSKTDFALFNSSLDTGGVIKGLVVNNASSKYSRKDLDKLTNEVKKYKAKGLFWLKYENDSFNGSISKFLTPEIEKTLTSEFELVNGDLIVLVAESKIVANNALGFLRNHLAKELNLIDKSKFNFLWVNNWPSFDYDEETKTYVAAHHPFTSPKDEDVDKLLTDPSNCYSKCYDIVLNGYELGSGSIRIHDQETQKNMFKAIGLTEEETKEKFGFFIDALKYGTPPHGGIALGLDRLVMILAGSNNLRDVIAFPKTASAIDPMSDAPSYVSEEQLRDLKIKYEK